MAWTTSVGQVMPVCPIWMLRLFFPNAGRAPAAALRAASFIRLRRVIVCFDKLLSRSLKRVLFRPLPCPENLHNTQDCFQRRPPTVAPAWFIIFLAARSNLSAAQRLKLTGGSERRWQVEYCLENGFA